MPPRTRTSGALVRMNPTREDEAYTKEVLRKTSEGFRAELTSGKSERITQNLRNQDEGTLRLQEYLMAAEVDARPPKKIDSLMDQNDALKLQKSLTALQVAPVQRSRIQEPPKYEITSEDKISTSDQSQHASVSETSSTSTPPESSPTPSPPPPPRVQKSPKDVPKPAMPAPPIPVKHSPIKKPPAPIQPSQEDEYTDEYVMVKQRVKRRPKAPSKLSDGTKVITAGEPGMLYAYKKAWGCAEYCYISTCGVLALMVLFIFSYLLMRLWTGCAGLGMIGTSVPLVPVHTGDDSTAVSCTGPSLEEIQSLLESNNKVLLKEWSSARAITLDSKEIHNIVTQVASKISEQQQNLEHKITELVDKHVTFTDNNITISHLKDLAKVINDDVIMASKERISALSDAITKFEKEMLDAHSATTSLLKDVFKNSNVTIGSTSGENVSGKIKAAVGKMSDAADAVVTAASSNFTALFSMIEGLSNKLESSYRSESITKDLQKLQQSILLDIQTQIKEAATATNQMIGDSLASIRTQTDSLSATLIDLVAKSAAGTDIYANSTSAVLFASESLSSIQHAMDKITITLGELAAQIGSGVNNNGSNSNYTNTRFHGQDSSPLLPFTLADLEELQRKTTQHVTEQAQNVTLSILERIDASDDRLIREANERADHLKTGLAGIIKKVLMKQSHCSTNDTGTISRGVVDDLRLQYTDFTKPSFGTKIAGKSDDITNIAESIKTLISGNERVRLMFNDNMSPGSCWPTKKTGYVVLRFKNPVTLYYGAISHPAAPKLSTARTTVPRDITFIGRTTSGKEIQLGNFTFDVDGPEQQAFQLQRNNDLIQVRVGFTNNGGEYTCVYNLGLFGEWDKDTKKP